MLSAEARRRLAVVLVGARNPQNIGAAARAMQDFGFADLRVVNDFAPPFEAAQLEATSAVGAGHVLASARRFTDLSDAIADCHVIVGTTAVGGRNLQRSVLPIREAATDVLATLRSPDASSQETTDTSAEASGKGQRVALLFGSEKTGLTTEHLSHCSLLTSIPLSAPTGRHLSMNLGQAVAVCLYELSRDGFEGARSLPADAAPAAMAQTRDSLTALLLALLERSDYARRFPANARPSVVRQLVGTLGKNQKEAETWMGILKHLLRALTPASPRSPRQGEQDL